MLLKLVTAFSGIGLFLLISKPLFFAQFYLFSRTILQYFAFDQTRLGNFFPLTGIPALIMFGYSCIIIFLHHDYKFVRRFYLILWIFIYYIVFTSFRSINLTASINNIFKITCSFGFFILVHNVIRSLHDAKKILSGILVTSIIPMAFGYYQFFFGIGGKGIEGMTNRMIGTLGFANAYGIFLSFVFVACLMILLNKQWKFQRWVIIPTFSSVIVSIMLSLNRGTWIALGLAILSASAMYFRNINKKWFIVSAIVLSFTFSGIVIKRFEQLSEKRQYMPGNTLQQRVNYWKQIYPLILQKPVFGYGIGTSTYVTMNQYKLDAIAHNDYLRLGIETGFVGLFLYLGFFTNELFRYLKSVRKKYNWYINYPMLIGIIYFLIISVAQNIYDHIVNLSLFLGLLALAHRWNELSNQPIPSSNDRSV